MARGRSGNGEVTAPVPVLMGEPVPVDGYQVITSDPPWPESGGGKSKRGADKHYDLMKPPAILKAMLRSEAWRPAESCLHFMWTTMSSLPSAMWLMDGLGFRYVTHGVWVKIKAGFDFEKETLEGGLDFGIGQYFRGAHELYLVGVRGHGFDVKTDDHSIPSVLFAPAPRETGKRVHSRKPPKFYDMVEKRTRGARLEMFARLAQPGWTAWGTLEHETDANDPLGIRNALSNPPWSASANNSDD